MNPSTKLSPRKYTLLAGTLLLTGSGLISRILGFFYRIFLSRTIGAEGLGLFNMIHPVFGICFALCAGSIQTAISQCVAANMKKGRSIFRTGLFISIVLSTALSFLIYYAKDFIAARILMEPRCAPLLTYIALSVPCSALHACINGYYYGMQKPKVPALAQIVEQTIRIGAVFLIADIMSESRIEITVALAAAGHLIGELASALFTVATCQFFPPKSRAGSGAAPKSLKFASAFHETAPILMAVAIPLMGNRLVLNLLASVEAIWIPGCLKQFGLNGTEAYSIYGVLTGMSLPFILFPSAITNSLAVMLLPTVAEAQALGNKKRIQATISMSLRYSLYMGILCIGIFTLFGNRLGITVYHNKAAGAFITTLAWLCPFMYLSTTLGSILNGLGKTSVTFWHNTAALVLRLGFVLFCIPRYGISGYLWGMLASELVLALLHMAGLHRHLFFSFNAVENILKPTFCLGVAAGILYAMTPAWEGLAAVQPFILITLQIGCLCVVYMGMLLLFHKKRE